MTGDPLASEPIHPWLLHLADVDLSARRMLHAALAVERAKNEAWSRRNSRLTVHMWADAAAAMRGIGLAARQALAAADDFTRHIRNCARVMSTSGHRIAGRF